MKCPTCDRPLPAGKTRCLYCGAAVKVADTSEMPDGDPPRPTRSEGPGVVRLEDLPEELRRQVEQALQATNPDVEGQDRDTSDPQPEPPDTVAGGDRMKGAAQSLASIRRSFDTDRIDYDEYTELVLQNLKQFLSGFEPKAALAFVLNDLKSSDLGGFIDDTIYKALCSTQLAVAVPPVEKPRHWAFGIFRKKRK